MYAKIVKTGEKMNENEEKKQWSDIVVFQGFKKKEGECIPLVRITKRYALVLSANFVRKNKQKFEEKTHLRMSYSKSNNAIIFKIIEEANNTKRSSDGKMKISRIGKRSENSEGNLSVYMESFMKSNEIDLNKSIGKYTAEISEILGEEAFVIYLDSKLD